MKKIKYLLIIFALALILPFSVNAKEKVKVYLFRGEGCPHCQEAEEFFDSIKSEYGKYYELIDYETWYDTDNADLMQKVADKLGEEVSGVPYIIIGKKTWNGYASTYDDAIKSAIKSEYNKSASKRYDVIKAVNGKTKEKSNVSSDILAVLIIILVVGGITYGIIMTRKKAS